MKNEGIKVQYWQILALIAVCVFGTKAAVGAEQNPFRLKPGAQGKNCLTCHVDFQDKLKQPFVHTPVKAGQCTGCHNPHASAYGKMLEADTNKICFKCHKNVIPDKISSSHKVVSEGNCVKCHDPHASKNKFNLLASGNDLCFGCHKDMGDRVKSVKFKHSPVTKGCINCHNPHGSSESVSLLKKGVPTLCLSCHKTDVPTFKRQHMNYPVAKARCTTCHDPHGSDRAGVLYTNVHQPVVGKMCSQCHEDPSSPTPFATKRAGFELCKGCHSNMVNNALNKNRIHWPVVDKTGCLHCHNPHAAKEKPLLRTTQAELCGECHADSIERQKQSLTKHQPVKDGQCTACHSAHASDNVFLFVQPTMIELCEQCHDFKKHSTHPVGANVIDPRNQNSNVQCGSCHDPHGTANQHMLHYSTTTEMCVQCHTSHTR